MEINGNYRMEMRKRFREVSGYSYLSLVDPYELDRPRVKQIIKKGREVFSRNGWKIWNYHVKQLKIGELKDFPPKRFLHNMTLNNAMPMNYSIPRVAGLIYDSTLSHITDDETKAYVITHHIPGDNFMTLIKSMSSEEKNKRLGVIGLLLRQFREQKVFLFDFAPRDIILHDGWYPVFVDMENVERGDDQKYLGKQVRQFNKDYKDFLKGKDLERARNIVFGDLENKID
ncbi:hypothetical protein KW787_03450 [Candidatus Pacearchaeota archaeon]|nr:hypothetical protein [Candidatus Pacearchaeota archaeon]